MTFVQLLIVMCLAQFEPSRALASEAANIRLFVVDPFGIKIKSPAIKLLRREDGRDFGSKATPDEPFEIPFGIYKLEVSKPGFMTSSRNIGVRSSEHWITVGLEYDPFDISLRGKSFVVELDSVPKADELLWARLDGLFIDWVEEAAVDVVEKKITFRAMPDGSYLFIIFSGTRVIEQRRVEVHKNKGPLKLVLSAQTGD